MIDVKLPQIENLQEITPEQAAEYVRYVATLRHNQNRWFKLRAFDALDISREMEKELDALNANLLDPTPRLFWWERNGNNYCVVFLDTNRFMSFIGARFTTGRVKKDIQNIIPRVIMGVDIMLGVNVWNVWGVEKNCNMGKKQKQKRYVRRDGFRELDFGFIRFEDRKTEKDSQKRLIQKRPMPKK